MNDSWIYVLVVIPILSFTMAGLFFEALIPKTVTYNYFQNGEPVTEIRTFGPYWHLAIPGGLFLVMGLFVSYLLAKEAIADIHLEGQKAKPDNP